MLLASSPIELRHQIKVWKQAGETIAFVPTMGNLHSGHISLVTEAKKHASKVVVSIFVNPLQFNNPDDLTNYPRTLEEDSDQLKNEGVDLLFTPTPDIMYPKGLEAQTFVEVPYLTGVFCGESRPGHFRGVSTIVNKLFNLVVPDVACFGMKDYQQLQIIKLMVEDLSLDIKVIGVETVRTEHGLAKSSRNGYLTQQELDIAPLLYKTMKMIETHVSSGVDINEALEQAKAFLASTPLETDYLHVQRADNLSTPSQGDTKLVILAAAYLGNARLIDNLVFER